MKKVIIAGLIVMFLIVILGYSIYAQFTTPLNFSDKITEDVYYVGSDGFGSYLIRTDEGLILIDAGPIDLVDTLIDRITSLGFDVEEIKIILNTHAHGDHTGGNNNIVEISNALTYINEYDAEAIELSNDIANCGVFCGSPIEETKVDFRFSDGDTIRLGDKTLEVIHVPGHTPGNSMVYSNVKGVNVLFSGDTIITNSNYGHPFFDKEVNSKKIVNSLKKVRTLNLEPDLVLPGAVYTGTTEMNPIKWNVLSFVSLIRAKIDATDNDLLKRSFELLYNNL